MFYYYRKKFYCLKSIYYYCCYYNTTSQKQINNSISQGKSLLHILHTVKYLMTTVLI